MLLRHINYFLAVAEHHSFTRAATALHVSQPALSQQIKQLEETLGAQLFDRTGRTMRLTDAGEVYFRYARRALQDLEEGKRAIHDVSDLSRGSLRVAVTPTFTTYLIGPLVKSFHNLYPNITLTVREMSQERIEELLVDDELDVGIAFDEIHSPDIDAQRLLVETLALVVGKEHPLAKCRTMSLKALNNESLVLLTSEFATRKQIDRYCRQNDICPRVLMEANSLSAVIEIIRHTSLATLLPAKIACDREELVSIVLTPSLLQRTAVLMQRKGAYQTAAARAFIELALEY
ncbi:transcriptional regulator CynR [Photorhabdus luminescens]|uniref:Transcriptional regulator CynR n=1 Tax=Photorhabdus akhurstii TaxID=171438 RepID=A0ABX8LXV0_9GAMM|nr:MULTISPECIES: transcriptional regulator CynR [Photorhabdus]KGM28153.1 transcriptional regulator [Photorhabdus luminescens]MBS9430065.1 transcriptional regulator CynR [Photorhabdus akhurstii]MCC8456874.1 transcriptional regulator CynR [Photorhabdus aegyptia]PQQ30141.1 transcriptional regulator CynR [Photorhabdus luminescens]PQQ32195.1 transcriptional regulator CynR [Photorhabdus luminescens]